MDLYYRDHEKFEQIIMSGLKALLACARGSMVTFNARDVVIAAGLPDKSILYVQAAYVLKAHGLPRERTAHGYRFVLTKDHPLWSKLKS